MKDKQTAHSTLHFDFKNVTVENIHWTLSPGAQYGLKPAFPGLTLILKTRWRRAAVMRVLPGLGAHATPVVPLFSIVTIMPFEILLKTKMMKILI